MKPVKFITATNHQNKKTVEYEADDGSILLKIGGDLSWRFNNPGNLIASKDISKQPGRIGIGTVNNPNKHDFAIFASYKDGINAKKLLLKGKYGSSTIDEMIAKYAPKSDGNDPKGYADHIINYSGASRTQKISDMDNATFEKVMQAIQKKEGSGKEGKEEWIKTTKITLSDGTKPVVGYPLKVTLGTCTYEWLTNNYGELPLIAHLNDGMRIEVKSSSPSGKEEVIYAATGLESKRIVLKKKSTQYTAHTLPEQPKKPREKSKPKPIEYIVESKDTLSKIASRFNVSISDISKNNNIKNINKIYPGKVLIIYGNADKGIDLSEQQPWEEKGMSFPVPPYPSKKDIELKRTPKSEVKPKVETQSKPEAKPKPAAQKSQKLATVGGKNSGNGQAHIPLLQNEAPWMVVAVKEAEKWGGVDESVIGDNFHKLLSANTKRTLSNTPWCASFVNYCFYSTNYKTSHNYAGSNSFADKDVNFKKIKKSVFGCLMIWQKSGNGHVAFVYGKDSVTDQIIVLGGNQDDSINFMLESDTTKNFVGYYVPAIYNPDFEKKLDEYDIVELNKEFGITYARKSKGKVKKPVKDR
ncbi:hypothetical protein BZ17_1022 [Yersinia pseudotuberculosis IP 32953]|uniref:Possible LysM domain n=5 Tax=Yersinia pseudotuberculosis complex TaxID=1649845 RepID=Q66CB1_YERPS|nr:MULTISPECIES: TIGR02594 family protein [Yersinia pseudotuberculosis complex]CQD53943.1 LysM domain-containing protein [Yersinia intermedia]AJJ02469.1 hypothetical protein BZ21_831 [Yersinia pseudotuberculosis]AJJ08902.1 hypothetical protein BZ20_471 [Yersinia pseudotuberculosis]AJJ57131.1 hypothetical protein BZ17_1022 [Yersinia pseudotuberculosis IP 32953]AJJ69055.1 hypothetical protein BZ16_907 [Yersinia pseudotuberculosis PB1/+]